MMVPGIGPIISSAIVAAIGTGDAFSKGRDFGAWLGLVPKQMAIYARCSFRQAGSCWSRSGPSSGSAMASSRGSRQPKNGCTATCWRSRSPTNSPVSPGRFSITGVPSSTERPMQQRPDLLDPRAVLRPVKAWPGNTGASRNIIATASLDESLRAARLCTRRPGRRNAPRHEQRNSMKQGRYR